MRVNCINPERTATPMRTRAFGDELAGSLLRSTDVAKVSLDTLIATGTGLVVDVRRLVHGLRPPALDDLGLVGALRAGAEGPGPRVQVVASGELDDLPAALEVAAYRIVQESLLNASKHAGAEHALVRLEATPDEVVVEIGDLPAAG